jgi:hypothetical protein
VLDVVEKQVLSRLVEVLSGFDQPSEIFHCFLQDGFKLFVLRHQLLLGVLGSQDGVQGEELFLMLDGKSEQFSQIGHVFQVLTAFFADERAVLVVEDVEQNGRVLINLPPHVVVRVKNVNQRVVVKGLVGKFELFPPQFKSSNHIFDFELLATLESDFF